MSAAKPKHSEEISGYVFDSTKKVYIKPDQTGIGYRDGGEDKLFKILSTVNDKSTFSSELVGHMRDWPSEYHFSRKRHLVLRPFNIRPGDTVLELGSGCGSITRYLAEIGAKVTAVEGELSRAATAAERCAGFSNARFITDNFLSLNLAEKFDWVLMIGVLEYSQKFGQSDDRQAEYLEIASRHLAPNGTLIVAIENKLGIKYINGAGEDHNGKRFYGPHDLYSGSDITTWGKAELQDILSNSGFCHQEFFAVFPDYKLPKVIFSEKATRNKEFRAEELLHYSKSLDYRGKNERAFDEALYLGSLRKNGLIMEMANSFVIACRKNMSGSQSDADTLAHYFSIDRRREYCTHTQFFMDESSRIHIRKTSIEADKSASSLPVFVTAKDGNLVQISQSRDVDTSPYLTGSLMGVDLTKAIKRGDAEAVETTLKTWVAVLLTRFEISCRATGEPLAPEDIPGRRLESLHIEGSAIDCGPQNIICGEDVNVFDLEWVSDEPVPLAWVICRNVKHALRLKQDAGQALQVTDVVNFVCSVLGVEGTETDLEEAAYMEHQFQSAVAVAEPSNSTSLSSMTGLS